MWCVGPPPPPPPPAIPSLPPVPNVGPEDARTHEEEKVCTFHVLLPGRTSHCRAWKVAKYISLGFKFVEGMPSFVTGENTKSWYTVPPSIAAMVNSSQPPRRAWPGRLPIKAPTTQQYHHISTSNKTGCPWRILQRQFRLSALS